MPLSHDPRILICRLSALGDCVHTMPLAAALRRRFPKAYIAWLTQPQSVPLLADHPDLDEVLTVPRGYLKSPARIAELRKTLRSRRFDVTIDPQSLSKSSIPAWLSGAKKRIGFARPSGREVAPLLNNVRVRPESLHVVDQNLELLRPLGVNEPDVEFKLPVSYAAARTIDVLLADSQVRSPVVIHPGAGWDSKLWPHQRYANVAKHLGDHYSARTYVVWYGERMRRWAEEIAAQSGGHAHVAPALTLPELVALLERARLFVGSDSGPLHMAAALQTPTVSMFGPTLPDRNGPYRQGHWALQAYYQGGTTRAKKRAGNHAMQAISSQAVIAACEQAIAPDLVRTSAGEFASL